MFLLCLVLISVLHGNPEVVRAEKSIVIKFSHDADNNTPVGQMAVRFRELITERFGEKVVVKVFPHAELYSDNTVLEAMLLGDVQLAAPPISKFAAFNRQMQLFDLPYLFQSRLALERFEHSAQGQALLQSLNGTGLVGLGYLNEDFKILSAQKPLRTPADAKGLRFRIQSSHVLAAQFRTLHATTMKAPFSQVTTLLRDNAVTAQENTWASMYSRGFYAEQPFVTVSNHGFASFMIVAADAFWQSIAPPLRQEIQVALNEAIAYGNNLAERVSGSAQEKIVASRQVRIIQLTDTEKRLWARAMRPVWHEFAEEIGGDLLDAAVEANQAGSIAKGF